MADANEGETRMKDPGITRDEGLEVGAMQDVDLGEVPENIVVTPAPEAELNGGLNIS